MIGILTSNARQATAQKENLVSTSPVEYLFKI